ncbi:MAG: AI-2E family transporter [Acidobacteria bacterium]|nr:AI-2E family transporter [Acidobacteriota bacterium]
MREEDRPGTVINHGTQARTPIEWMRWVPATTLALVFLLAVFISGRIILVPLLSSLALAYLLHPLVSWIERRGWSRSSSVLLAFTAATVSLVLVLLFIVPGLWAQLTKTYNLAQALISERSRLDPLLSKFRQISPQFYQFAKPYFDSFMNSIEPGRLLNLAAGWLQSGLFRLVDLTASILDLLLIPFFVYYLLVDYRAMRARIDRLIPPRYHSVTSDLIGQINRVLSSYVLNQLLIGLIMGGMYSVGFFSLRVPMAVTLGMLSGLLNFVPYLGTLTGLAFSLAFVALDGAGFGRISGVILVFIIVQSVEGYYLTPKLLGSRLHIHPLWVLAGLVIGGNLFGLVGIILAVPVIAIAKVVFGFLEKIYQQSNFYRRAGLSLLTDQGQPVDLVTPSDSSIILEETQPQRSRRVVTTGELRSRIRDNKPSSDD